MPKKTNEEPDKKIKTTTKPKPTSTPSKKKSTVGVDALGDPKNIKTTTKKTKTVVKTAKKTTAELDLVEYYDLPYRYNKTVVKILAQTPNRLFVYWDISDGDRFNYESDYGKDFFSITKPVLVVHNISKNYSFEIEINDFANSWYFDINDEKCEYVVELGRRYREEKNDYIHIVSSNNIDVPNDHILFEKEQNVVYFRNVKTNESSSKNTTNFSLLNYMGKPQSVSYFYNKIYKDMEIESFKNPSSR